MNILLTNDDGFDSEGIQKLAEALRLQTGHRVFVIAPDINRSGISHALSIFHSPVKLKAQGEDSWSCSGYPVDCVLIAMNGGLPVKPDLVLSGINRGSNLGTDIVYSGTAAAARQGSFYNIPSIALSLVSNGPYHWDTAVSWVIEHLEELMSYWTPNAFVNVNIPNSPTKPGAFALAWPALKTYDDKIVEKTSSDGNRVFFLEAGKELAVKEKGSDYDVISCNLVSVSPVYNYPAVIRELCPASPDYAAVSSRSNKKE